MHSDSCRKTVIGFSSSAFLLVMPPLSPGFVTSRLLGRGLVNLCRHNRGQNFALEVAIDTPCPGLRTDRNRSVLGDSLASPATHLNLQVMLVDVAGIEPATPCLQSRVPLLGPLSTDLDNLLQNHTFMVTSILLVSRTFG